MFISKGIAGLLAVGLSLAGALLQGEDQSLAKRLNPENIPAAGPTRLQAQNISFQLSDDVTIRVATMDGLLLPTHAGQPISLDDPRSMRVLVQSAHASITAEDLTRLLNEYTLPHAQSNVRELIVTFVDGKVHIVGKLKKLVEIPFSATGDVEVTPDGNVRIHMTQITAMGFVHKKMLDFLGMNAATVAGPSRSHSFQVVDDDVVFPIHTLFPAPHFTGHLRSVKIDGDDLVQQFGSPRGFPPAPIPADHYIYFRGGTMQCGRMTMQGVDLELLNKDDGKTFSFSLEHSFEQVLPGYLKNRPNYGLVAYITSYNNSR